MWTLLAPTSPTPAMAKAATAAAEETGSPWLIFVLIAVGVLLLGGIFLFVALRKNRAGTESQCASCGKMMLPEWDKCMFCKVPRHQRQAALAFVSGPMMGKSLELTAEVTTIGAAEGSTVHLVDNGVSRKHAGIRKAEGGYELADLGSTNGVYVNGEKVAKRKLQLGDVIRVGTTEMVFKD